MVEFLFTLGSIGLLYKRSTHAGRRRRDGHRTRWRLLLRGLSLIPSSLTNKTVSASAANVGSKSQGTRLGHGVITLMVALTLNLSASLVVAQQTLSVSESQAKESMQWLATRAMQEVPPVYTGDKDWGDTKKVWAGVRAKFDGLKLKTHRRFKQVNHGRWIRYEIKLPEVNAPNAATTKINSATRNDQDYWRIDSTTETPMQFTAKVERWNLGVKLYSVTVTGRMKVQLQLTSTIGLYLDYSEIPPAVVANPIIVGAKLTLVSFEIDRVSKIGGDAAEAWGEIMQEVLIERFIENQNDRIVSKLNKAIEKHRDDLRFSWSMLLDR